VGCSVLIEHYSRPSSASEAASLLAADPAAFPLAGGTDILIQARAGTKTVGLLVDLKHIPGLAGIEWSEQAVRIGAATPSAELTADSRLNQVYPGLVEAIELIGGAQIQSRCSVGGNLCNASPAADTTPALIVNLATAIVFGPAGERELPITELITGPGLTALEKGEFLMGLRLPLPQANRADAALRLIPRTEMDIAAANAAVSLELNEAGGCKDLRLAIGAVGPRAVMVTGASSKLEGRPLDTAALDDLAKLARAAAQPIDDKRGTVAYRRHVIGVLAQRAALKAKQRVEAAQ
jgi:CO/xanthine dehydrogenase FAD-binding subunit